MCTREGNKPIVLRLGDFEEPSTRLHLFGVILSKRDPHNGGPPLLHGCKGKHRGTRPFLGTTFLRVSFVDVGRRANNNKTTVKWLDFNHLTTISKNWKNVSQQQPCFCQRHQLGDQPTSHLHRARGAKAAPVGSEPWRIARREHSSRKKKKTKLISESLLSISFEARQKPVQDWSPT